MTAFPGPVTGLIAYLDDPDDTIVALRWQPLTGFGFGDVGGDLANHYRIYKIDRPGATPVQIGDVQAGVSSAQQFFNPPLEDGRTGKYFRGYYVTPYQGATPGTASKPVWHSWRPFARNAAFNLKLPTTDLGNQTPQQLDWVKRLLANPASGSSDGGLPGQLHAWGTDDASDFGHAAYYAKSTDEYYKVASGKYLNYQVPMPAGALPSGADDHHMTIVTDRYKNASGTTILAPSGDLFEWSFGGVAINTGTSPKQFESAGINLAVRFSLLSSLGITGDPNGVVAGGWSALMGMIRSSEMQAGLIPHALFVRTNAAATSSIPPATRSDGNNDPNAGYPPMGARFRLKPSVITDAYLNGLPTWKQTIMRAMRDYGWLLGDTTGQTWVPSFESSPTHRTQGERDAMVDYFATQSVGGGLSTSGSGYVIDMASSSFFSSSKDTWMNAIEVVPPTYAPTGLAAAPTVQETQMLSTDPGLAGAALGGFMAGMPSETVAE